MTRARVEFVFGKLANIRLQSNLLGRIKTAQQSDPVLQEYKEKFIVGSTKDFSISSNGLLQYKDRVCVPADDNIKQEILDESHTMPYSLHPGTTKMYQDVKAAYWWPDFEGSWNKYLPLTEFSYNNNYQSTIGMAPYEMLYGRKCRSPIHWDEVSERRYLGPDAFQRTSETIEKIRARMLTS
ncbi:hypothetical protein CsatB_007457 [Cannabis sativa]|uniref:uncharacterized protein LOC115723621 n=1 Tax=Cannabis sativa TaxID=3483 RepID=UPI0029C9BBD6|nr:uncharacterized protein LOC115723621 [Cannabis sativa]